MRTFNEQKALEFIENLPWGTAAGTSKDARMIIKYAQAGAKIVHFGSVTWEPRIGNAGDNFYFDPVTGNSINAWGLPNRGIHAYIPELKELRRTVNELGSKLSVSISAGDFFASQEYEDMTELLIHEEAADIIAGNFSCPNVVLDGVPKPVVCYDLNAFTSGVEAMICQAEPHRVAVKIAPITEKRILGDLVDVCLKHHVGYIEGANTEGNCYMEKPDGSPAITMIQGGGAGRMLAPKIRGMTRMLAPRMKGTHTKFIAIGGILNGTDAYTALKLGADGFQFNTALSARGGDPRVIHEMIVGTDLTASGLFPDGSESKGLLQLLVENGLPD